MLCVEGPISKPLTLESALIASARGSMVSAKRAGLSGHPCPLLLKMEK